MKKIKVAIIGSGPSGYTAAIYTARAKLKPTLFSGLEIGGQLTYTRDVENFPGFSKPIAGVKLMQTMKEQAERFGMEIKMQAVTAVDFQTYPFKLWTKIPEGEDVRVLKKHDVGNIQKFCKKVKKQQHDYEAESVIVSTGAAAILLHIPGEKKFLGRGVSTCAVCDAAFYKDKKVYVVGGGDSAMEDALALAKFTDQVHVVHRRNKFSASKIMQERVLNNKNIDVLWNSTVQEVVGEDHIENIKLKTEDKVETVSADGLFLAIGHRPVSGLFVNELQVDKKGYIVTPLGMTKQGCELSTDRFNDRELVNFPSMTSKSGVFAAGDVVDHHYKQAITSASMGCQSALDAQRWLEDKNK